MKKTTTLLAGAVLLGSVGVVSAQDLDRGVQLTTTQMSGVTAAGWGSKFKLNFKNNTVNVNETNQYAEANSSHCFIAHCSATATNNNTTNQGGNGSNNGNLVFVKLGKKHH